ncbi:MAG TPA: SPOR domain-containing protein [Pyrinomonadaceae bacterium]|nr:SPOR domain-containing protein [Pyrinomonadaceae bacterium]
MTQDESPAPAVVDEEKALEVVESAVIEYVPASPPVTSPKPKPAKAAPPPRAAAADPFAVGVRVLKMAPAWLLFTAVCCSALVMTLGWVRSTGEAESLPSKRNDARAAKAEKASAKPEAGAPASASLAGASGPKTTAANDAPAPAPTQAAAPQPEPRPGTAAAPKADEKPRVETPAPAAEGGGNFTAQVGSFNSQSEANERVSSLRAAGFDARSVVAELPGRGTWYRVQVGRFADRGEAAKTVAALRAKGAASAALVVPVQK